MNSLIWSLYNRNNAVFFLIFGFNFGLRFVQFFKFNIFFIGRLHN